MSLENRFEDNISMEELLESAIEIESGKVVSGEVVSADSNNVYVNIGGKMEGRCPVSEFDRIPAAGERVDVLVKSTRLQDGMYPVSRRAVLVEEKWKKFQEWATKGNETVSGRIVKKTEKGAIVEFEGITGYLPFNHAGDIRMKDEESFKKEYTFRVIDINEKKKTILLSRRVLVDEVKEKAWESIMQNYKVGDTINGTVVRFTEFGTFVDLNGYDALLHNNDLSWSKSTKRKNILEVGQKGEFKILSVDVENRKISLGLKQMSEDPWSSIERKYRPGDTVSGRVTTVTSFGVFIELESGVEGLAPSSEISWTKKFVNPKDLYKKEDVLSAVVLDINREDRKISLSIKKAESNPWLEIEKRFPVGSVQSAPVKNITNFGLFVELAPEIDGLVHISDVSWDDDKKDLAQAFKLGETVTFKILSVNIDEMRISCGIKQLVASPWEAVREKYPPRMKLQGTISSITSFGLFVRLEEKLEGLVHISEVSKKKIDDLNAEYKIGDTVTVMVLDVDTSKKKISLSMKSLEIMNEKEELKKIMGNDITKTATIADLIKKNIQ